LIAAKAPFQLNGIDRLDETPFHEAIREAVANTLIHADYHGSRGIVIEKFPNGLKLQNPGNFRISITAAKEGGISDPRNTSIFKAFLLVGIGERAGSGLHSIHYIWKKNILPPPVLSEFFDPDRILFLLKWDGLKISSEKTEISSEKTDKKILRLLKQNNGITISELAKAIGITTRAIEKQLENLKGMGIIERLGSDKGGHWKILK
jgi:predicted HTH transcriptional regulator